MRRNRTVRGAGWILFLSLLGLPSAAAADAPLPFADPLYSGWLQMYDLQFDEAHRVFTAWRSAHAADPLGPISESAAYLFAELARLGALESEFFTDDRAFIDHGKLSPNAAVKRAFLGQMERADRLTSARLQENPSDGAALFSKALGLGLRADYAALVDREYLTAFSYTKQARAASEQLLAVDPGAFDAYIGPGIEHYLLSLKSAPVRWLMRLTGAHIDPEKGLAEVRKTAAHGRYLEPFAKLLLAVAALRDNQQQEARIILADLHNRFPHNDLYSRELNRLKPH